MSKFNFSESYQKAEKEYDLGGGGTFKPKEGDNKIRLVSEPIPHSSFYKGKKQFKWLSRVIDRADSKIKLFFMPTTIYKSIEAMQQSEDYSFDEIPMPYDLVINAKGAGTKEVVYTVLPSKEKPLTEEEKAEIAKAEPLTKVQEKIFEKQSGVETAPIEDEEVDVDMIPF